MNHELEVQSADNAEPILEMGPPVETRRPAALIVVSVVMLLAGIAIGLFAGHLPSVKPSTRPSPVAAPATGDTRGYVVWGDSTCADMSGNHLGVGMNITNHSNTTVTLISATVTVPQNVLRLVATAWNQCGQGPTFAGAMTLQPGASAWISASTEMLTACPARPTITFAVTYQQDGEQKELRPTDYNDDTLQASCDAQ